MQLFNKCEREMGFAIQLFMIVFDCLLVLFLFLFSFVLILFRGCFFFLLVCFVFVVL